MAGEGQVTAPAIAEQDWELSKENYQPLKAGRKPGALQGLASIDPNPTVDEQRSAYWKEVEDYKGDDPLEVWLRFIKWTQETFKSGGHKAEVLPLLERCTRELQSLDRYKTDIRYLRVWVQYADCLPDPGDVFSFLKENDIGQDHALYYIAHATYMELRGNYAGADNIYQQSINRSAAPLERLRAKFDEFQHRMARRIQRKAQEQVESEDPSNPERHTLGVLGGRKNRNNGLGGSKRKAVATPGKEASNNTGGGLQIFVDDVFGGPAGSAPAALGGIGGGSAGASSVDGGSGFQPTWSQLPSFEQTRKENVMQAGTWVGQRIRQKQVHSAPAAPPLEIPIDPEFTSAEAEAAAQHAAAATAQGSQPSLRQRLDRGGDGTLDEQLSHDPLSLHRGPGVVGGGVVPSVGGGNALRPLSASTGMTTSTMPGGSTASGIKPKREEVFVAKMENLTGEDGEELSFEELRARKWLDTHAAEIAAAKAKATPALSSVTMKSVVMQSVENVPSRVSPFDPPPDVPAPAAPAAPVSRAAEAAMSAIQSTVNATDPAGDVTMSTKDAFAAINAMFSSKSFGGAAAVAEAELGSFGFEPTMTINTRDAFAAINIMFKGSAPLAVSESFGAEPTVSLKAAYEAVNNLFGSNNNPPNPNHPAIQQQHIENPAYQHRPGSRSVNNVTNHQQQQQGMGDDEVVNSPGGFLIREDTVFISGAMGSGSNPDELASPTEQLGGCGFDIREDTVFINHNHPAAAADEAGLGIREDTFFINHRPNSGMMMDIREDTVFINRSAADNGDNDGVVDSPGGFDVREDTIFINRPAAGGGQAKTPAVGIAARADGQCTILPDTVVAGRGQYRDDNDDTGDLLAGCPVESLGQHAQQVGKWGFAPGADDTVEIGALRALPGTEGTSLTQQLGGLNILDGTMAESSGAEVEDKENCGDENKSAVPLKDLKLCSSSVFQPTTRDIEIGADSEAEAALAAAPDSQAEQSAPLKDQFQVFCDEDQSMYPAAETMTTTSNVETGVSGGTKTVDPFSLAFKPRMLRSLDPPVSQWPGVSVLTPEEEQAAGTAVHKRGKKGAAPLGAAATTSLAGIEFMVGGCIGSGAYATVHQASVVNTETAAAAMLGGTCPSSDVALKYESPPCPWEWYICRALQGRVPEAQRSAFLDPAALLMGKEASVLVMPRGRSGTLQDLLNVYLKKGQRPDECLVIHCAVQLLKMLQMLCAARILHTDIKPDNFLVIMPSAPGSKLDLQLIDFGRSVDLELLPSGCLMRGDCGTDGFRCVEMREGTPWLWQADAYGIAGVLHCLLFGEYMDVERVLNVQGDETFLRIKASLRRYWDVELWTETFHQLLNGAGDQQGPRMEALVESLEVKLAGMGVKLEEECSKLVGCHSRAPLLKVPVLLI